MAPVALKVKSASLPVMAALQFPPPTEQDKKFWLRFEKRWPSAIRVRIDGRLDVLVKMRSARSPVSPKVCRNCSSPLVTEKIPFAVKLMSEGKIVFVVVFTRKPIPMVTLPMTSPSMRFWPFWPSPAPVGALSVMSAPALPVSVAE